MSALSAITIPNGTTYDLKDAAALRSVAAAPSFSDSASYAVGDVVTKDGLVYRCSTAHSAAAWNAAHFTVVDQFIAAGGKVNASLLPAATTSAFGAVKPDGTTITVLNGVISTVGGGGGGGGGVDPRYTLPASATAVTPSSGSATLALADRTLNYATISSTFTTLNLTFPSAVANKVRDFGLRIEVASGVTAPAIAISGVTVENADAEWPTIENGGSSAASTAIFYFTETKSGTFLVRSIVVEAASAS